MATWYLPIDKVVKIGEQHSAEAAYGRLKRPVIRDSGQIEIHHLVVVDKDDEPIGVVTLEAVETYLLKNPTRTGSLPPRPRLVTECMASREKNEILEYPADKPQHEVREDVLSRWEHYRNAQAVFLLAEDKVVGFATTPDIFRDGSP